MQSCKRQKDTQNQSSKQFEVSLNIKILQKLSFSLILSKIKNFSEQNLFQLILFSTVVSKAASPTVLGYLPWTLESLQRAKVEEEIG